jgi:hypothetical protein
MANSLPPEAYPVAERVPHRASNGGKTPLNQPATQPATPIVSVPDPGRQRPSMVSQPSGLVVLPADSGYPSGTNLPAPVPVSMPGPVVGPVPGGMPRNANTQAVRGNWRLESLTDNSEKNSERLSLVTAQRTALKERDRDA